MYIDCGVGVLSILSRRDISSSLFVIPHHIPLSVKQFSRALTMPHGVPRAAAWLSGCVGHRVPPHDGRVEPARESQGDGGRMVRKRDIMRVRTDSLFSNVSFSLSSVRVIPPILPGSEHKLSALVLCFLAFYVVLCLAPVCLSTFHACFSTSLNPCL